jgi:hypothetical protein
MGARPAVICYMYKATKSRTYWSRKKGCFRTSFIFLSPLQIKTFYGSQKLAPVFLYATVKLFECHLSPIGVLFSSNCTFHSCYMYKATKRRTYWSRKKVVLEKVWSFFPSYYKLARSLSKISTCFFLCNCQTIWMPYIANWRTFFVKLHVSQLLYV